MGIFGLRICEFETDDDLDCLTRLWDVECTLFFAGITPLKFVWPEVRLMEGLWMLQRSFESLTENLV